MPKLQKSSSMTRSILLAVCVLFIYTSVQAQGRFTKIKYAQLTKAGVTSYSKVAKSMPEIKVVGSKLIAEKGYTLWADAKKRLIVAPQEVKDPSPVFSTMAERRKYPMPGGGTIVIVCFCVSEEGMLTGDDDCHFDNSHGAGPLMTQCKGECGCARANGFEPDTPGGSILITTLGK